MTGTPSRRHVVAEDVHGHRGVLEAEISSAWAKKSLTVHDTDAGVASMLPTAVGRAHLECVLPEG